MHAGPNLECSIVKMTERSLVTVKLFFLVQTGTEQIISYKLSAYLIVWISAIAKSVLYTMYNSLQSKQYMENTSVWDHCFLVHLLCWGKWYNMVEINLIDICNIIPEFFLHDKIEDRQMEILQTPQYVIFEI